MDLVGLLRLSTALFDQINSSDGQSKMSHSPQLLATLLGNNQDKATAAIQDGISTLFTGFSKAEPMNTGVDRTLLTLFIDAAAKLIHGEFSSNWSCTPQHQMIQRYLLDSEQFSHGRPNLSSFSDWLKANKTDLTDQGFIHFPVSRLVDKSSDQWGSIISSLCDFFIELLADDCSVATLPEEDTSNTIARRDTDTITSSEYFLISAADLLWDRKQKLSWSSSESDSIPCDKVCRLIHGYSRHLAVLLKTNGKKDVLVQLERAIKHVIYFCKLAISSGAKTTSCFETQYAAFWNLYCSVADENSSRALVSLILGVYNEAGWAPISPGDDVISTSGVNAFAFSITSISSNDVFDEQIHYIRSSFLSFISHLTGVGVQITVGLSEKSSLLRLLIQSVLKLCRDMCDGVHGQSGGMRRSLFLLLVESIERSISNIATIIDTLTMNTLHECISSLDPLNEAALIVWNTFCEHSFSEGFLVKSILSLCTDKLPGLIRKIEVNACRPINANLQLMPCAILLDQAGASLRETNTRSDVETINTDCDSTEKTEVTNLQDVSSYPITQMVKPVFASKSVASWACNIALTTISTIWNESNKFISAGNPRHSAIINSTDKMTLAKLRVDSFQTLHSSVCKMFDTIDIHISGLENDALNVMEEENISAKVDGENISTMLCELLPPRGKSYLCHCLEKMLITMNSSIKAFTSHFNQTVSFRNGNKQLIEPLACIVGFSSSIVLQNNKAFDVITGPARWFTAESSADNYSMLHRLPKILYRSESIEIELQNLCLLIRGLNEQNSDHFLERVGFLNEVAFVYTPKATMNSAFIELLERCIQIIQARIAFLRATSSAADLFSDDDDNTGSGDEANMSVGLKRRQPGAATARRTRRKPLRSRNETIDDWLTLDDEDFAGTSGEVYNNDDAYVDLEDFIVEG
jgi:hypothetical protein